MARRAEELPRAATPAQMHPVAGVLLVLAAFAALLWTWRRLSYGVDFNDESFYAALAWRFVLGDRPFVDEVNPVQASALLTQPLVWSWTSAHGGTDGLLYFLRLVYFASTCAVGAAAYALLRRHVAWPLALALATFGVLLVPAGLPAPSYNTCASGLFALGLFLGALAAGSGRPRILLAGAGASHALASLCLPTYAGACAIFFVLGWREHALPARARRAYVLGGLLALLPFVPALAGLGAGTLEYTQAYWGGFLGWLAHLGKVLVQLWTILPRPGLLLAGLLVLWACRRRGGLAGFAGAILVALAPAGLHGEREWVSSLCFSTLLACLAPLAYALLPAGERPGVLFRLVVLPSLACGLIAGWTSGNGVVNSGFGAWPAALVASLLLVQLARGMLAGPALWRDLAALAPALVVLVLLARDQRWPYQEDELAGLDARVEAGPFRGLRTSFEKRAYVEDLRRDVLAHADPEKPILFALQLPAGYLFTRCPPATRSCWGLANFGEVGPEDDPARFSADVIGRLQPGALIVRVHEYRFRRNRLTRWPRGMVDQRIEPVCETLLDRSEYTLYRLR